MKKRFALWLLAFLLLLLGCAEVPLTQRKALRLVSDQQLLSLSLQEYRRVIGSSRLSNDPERLNSLRRVGFRIAKAAEEFLKETGLGHKVANYRWEFNLIEDPKVVNAWCMPGGKVAVYTGILRYTKDEAGLAVVISHEVAHAILEHGNERMSQALLVEMGGTALNVALQSRPAETRDLFAYVYGLTASLGLILPYSRVQEEEADRVGLILMAKAGYDPKEAISFWERMKAESGPRMPEFLSTHPLPETRMAYIRAYIPEAMRYYRH